MQNFLMDEDNEKKRMAMLGVYPVIRTMMYETLEDCLQDFTQNGLEDCLPQVHNILTRRFGQLSQRLLRHGMTDSDSTDDTDDDEQAEDVQHLQASVTSEKLMGDLYSAYFECNTSVFDDSLPKKLDLALGVTREEENMSWKSGTMQASIMSISPLVHSTTPAVLKFLDMIVNCYMRQKQISSLPTVMQGRMDQLRRNMEFMRRRKLERRAAPSLWIDDIRDARRLSSGLHAELTGRLSSTSAQHSDAKVRSTQPEASPAWHDRQ